MFAALALAATITTSGPVHVPARGVAYEMLTVSFDEPVTDVQVYAQSADGQDVTFSRVYEASGRRFVVRLPFTSANEAGRWSVTTTFAELGEGRQRELRQPNPSFRVIDAVNWSHVLQRLEYDYAHLTAGHGLYRAYVRDDALGFLTSGQTSGSGGASYLRWLTNHHVSPVDW